MKKRKLLSAILAASLLASTVPATAWASGPNTEPVATAQASARSGELTVSGGIEGTDYEWLEDNVGKVLVVRSDELLTLSGDVAWNDTCIRITNGITANLKFSGVTIEDRSAFLLEQGATANIECENSTIAANANENTALNLEFIGGDNYYDSNSIEGIRSEGDVVLEGENGSVNIDETVDAKNVTINNGRYNIGADIAIEAEALLIKDGDFSGFIDDEWSLTKLAKTTTCTIHGGTFHFYTGDGSAIDWSSGSLIQATYFNIDGGMYKCEASVNTLGCADIAENTVYGCPVAEGKVINCVEDDGTLLYEVVDEDQVSHYIVSGDPSEYIYDGRRLTLKDGANVTVSSNGKIGDQIALEGNLENPTSAIVTLAGIDFYGPMPGIVVNEGCELMIVLQDGSDNSCEIGWTHRAAVEVQDEATLTIRGNGGLQAESFAYGAAIGTSDDDGYNAKINIEGGIIDAQGGENAVAIGGGLDSFQVTVNISGGNIRAIGDGPEGNSTGIGGGDNARINISGGDIYAEAYTGAAIGGDRGSSGINISIEGGNITAHAGLEGAGIGSGKEGQVSNIQISGEDTVINAEGSIGIGSGFDGTVGTINISDGKITANGGFHGAGIGGDKVGAIKITGGTVEAYGGEDAAGIGAGYGGVGGTFSTGNGNPVIITNSISDQNSESIWNGVFIVDNMNGGVGKVYGSKVTPTNDFTIPEGKTLEVNAGHSLIVAKGITATNNGTVIRDAKGTVDVQGTWKGNPVVVRDSEEDVAVTSVQLNKRTLSLEPTETETLTATVSPDNASNKSVRWTSSDSDVATVDENGKVTAIAKGTAVITVSTVDGGYTAQCTVTVSSGGSSSVMPPVNPKPDDDPTPDTETTSDGSKVTTTVDENGVRATTVSLSEKLVEQAEGDDKAVTLPIDDVKAMADIDTAPSVTVELPDRETAKVEIPVRDMTPGTVAVLVDEDGNETVINNSVVSSTGLVVTLSDGDTVKIVDNTRTYSDVSADHWAKDNIDYVTSRGLFVGVNDEDFAPETAMTRAMIVSVLQRYDGDTTTASGAWYEGARQWAVENGISDGLNMDSNVSREQLVTMLYRFAGSPASDGSLADYRDSASVSAYAKDAMAWAVDNGIIGGMTADTLAPQGLATRAQVAAIIERFIAWEQA